MPKFSHQSDTNISLINMGRKTGVRNRAASFRIEIPGDDGRKAEFWGKMQSVRNHLHKRINRPVNNNKVLSEALDFWILKHAQSMEQTEAPISYIETSIEQNIQKLFITAEKSVQSIVDIVQNHAHNCASELTFKKLVYRGHVALLTLHCGNQNNPHILKWSSSPYLPNKEYLVNHRVVHGFSCSGMLPIHYKRFCNGVQLGFISKSKRKNIDAQDHSHVTNVFNESIEQALHEEIGSYEDVDGVDIMTDARHGWRKNAKDSSVVAIGEKNSQGSTVCTYNKTVRYCVTEA